MARAILSDSFVRVRDMEIIFKTSLDFYCLTGWCLMEVHQAARAFPLRFCYRPQVFKSLTGRIARL